MKNLAGKIFYSQSLLWFAIILITLQQFIESERHNFIGWAQVEQIFDANNKHKKRHHENSIK